MARAGAKADLTGDRTILGKISKRGNRYLRVLFVQAAWVVLIKPMSWDHDGSLEVPVFTSNDYVFESLLTEAVLLTARGLTLSPQLLELLRSEDLRQCEVALDPGQSHAIRLSKEMILGMICAYGAR